MQAPHILPLTGIRFIAAVWVVFFHFQGTIVTLLPGLDFLNIFFLLGHYAVPLFFLLSGFILSHNYFSTYSLAEHPRFVFLRFARLWPVHGLTFFLTVFYGGLRIGDNAFIPIAQELLMVRSWFHHDLAWNFPAWSVSVEWFAYIFLFPLAFLLLKPIRSWVLLLALLVSLLAAHSFLPLENCPGRAAAIFFLFFTGSTLYRIRCLKPNLPGRLIQNMGAVLVLSYVFFSNLLPSLVIFSGFAAVVFGLSYQQGLLSRILSTKIAVLGGLASYSLYMTHAVVRQIYLTYTWDLPPQPLLIRVLLFVGLVAALGVAAWACYYYIEEPANKKLRQLANKPRRSEANCSPAPQSVA